MLLGLTNVDVDIVALHLVIIRIDLFSCSRCHYWSLPDHAKQTSYLSGSEPKTRPIVTRLAKASLRNAMWPCRNCTPGWVSLFMQDHLQHNLVDAVRSSAIRAPSNLNQSRFNNRRKLKIMCMLVLLLLLKA